MFVELEVNRNKPMVIQLTGANGVGTARAFGKGSLQGKLASSEGDFHEWRFPSLQALEESARPTGIQWAILPLSSLMDDLGNHLAKNFYTAPDESFPNGRVNPAKSPWAIMTYHAARGSDPAATYLSFYVEDNQSYGLNHWLALLKDFMANPTLSLSLRAQFDGIRHDRAEYPSPTLKEFLEGGIPLVTENAYLNLSIKPAA